MTREEITKNIVRGITDKIEATTDIDDWAEFWGFTRDDYEEFLDKALDQEPCEDCISRADAKEIIAQTDITDGYESVFSGRQVIALLNDLPSIQPKTRTGHWIKSDPFTKPYCSKCGEPCFGLHGFDCIMTDFCPNCGAKMEG